MSKESGSVITHRTHRTDALNISRSELVRMLSLSGDTDFELARVFAERAGFDLKIENGELRKWCTSLATRGDQKRNMRWRNF